MHLQARVTISTLCTILVCCSTTIAAPITETPLYKDTKASIEDRVNDLISRMTTSDKVAQLMQSDFSKWINPKTGVQNVTGLVNEMVYKKGQFYVGYYTDWDTLVKGVQLGQNFLMKNTTLGIPAWIQTEGLHGFLAVNATIFNSPIGIGCAFDPDLVRQMAAVIADEAATLGINQLFSPVVDLARELRFGRVEETYGEDAYLSGEMGYAYVSGLQARGVAAMVKHFFAFASPEQGLNLGPVHGGERELRRTYLPAFKRAIIDAGAVAIMTSYNSYDGMPAITDHYVLTDILRGEWGYEYYTMSDAGATDMVCTSHGLCSAGDMQAATKYILPAGNDVEMGGGSFNFQSIPQLLSSGQISQDVVDTAVKRVLRAKFKMGLFEKPLLTASKADWQKKINNATSKALARRLDRESIVLLENKQNILPLKKDISSIAVVGPMADGFMNYGDYVIHYSQYRGVTPLSGIKNSVGKNTKVLYAKGCERWSNDRSGFSEAVATASKAEVAVVVVGTWSRDQDELWQGLNATTGEHVDVSNLNLVGAQADLVRAIINTGKPTIVILSSGKPITETWMSTSVSALIQQFYPSEEGGNALADVLFGDYNPSGKLSVSFPRDIGTAPAYYDYLKGSGRYTGDAGSVGPDGSLKFGHQYVLDSPAPWYPFGYGLSYSTFKYGNLVLSTVNATAGSMIKVQIDIENTSNVDGTEVVQFYVQDRVATVVVPNKELKGFAKIRVPARSRVVASAQIDVSTLGVWTVDGKYVVEPGEFLVIAGSDSMTIKSTGSFWVS